MTIRMAVIFLWAVAGAFGQLAGVIDLHVHSAPDSMPRSIDALEIARIAKRHDMRALLFKNHYTSTAPLAYLVSQAVPGIEVYGGIALNRSVGGINPAAVDHMTKTTGGLGRVVWMPTFDSEHYHRTIEPNPNYVPVSRDGDLLPDSGRQAGGHRSHHRDASRAARGEQGAGASDSSRAARRRP